MCKHGHALLKIVENCSVGNVTAERHLLLLFVSQVRERTYKKERIVEEAGEMLYEDMLNCKNNFFLPKVKS